MVVAKPGKNFQLRTQTDVGIKAGLRAVESGMSRHIGEKVHA